MKRITITLDPEASEILCDAGAHHVAIIRKVDGGRMLLTSLPVSRRIAGIALGVARGTHTATKKP